MYIPINPVPKPRMTRSDRWKQRPATDRYWAYKADLQRYYLGKVPAELAIIFYIPMPKSWSEKKKREMDGKPHQVKPDSDNLLKAFLDCLCIDDAYVYDEHTRKFWAYEGGIEVSDPEIS